MKKLAIAFAGLAALGFAGSAFAEDGTTTTTGPAAMSDSEMDGVTAAGQPSTLGAGILTAAEASEGRAAGTPPEGKGLGQGTTRGPVAP